MHRRAEKVLRALGWELYADFEHLDESVLATSGYLDAIVGVLNAKAGVREDDEKRRAFRLAITDHGRHRDESLSQFVIRRQRDFRLAASHGLEIPNYFKATLLREGAGLSEQSLQNLVALLRGRDDDPDAVCQALAKLDVRTDRLSAFAGSGDDETFASLDSAVDGDVEEASEEDILQELESMDLVEDQIDEVFAVLGSGGRKRTWKENKQYKAEAKKDRGSFVKGPGAGAPRGQAGGIPGGRDWGASGRDASGREGRQRLSREQLKKISRCRLCNEKGHWAEDCPQKKSKPGPSAFAYVSDVGGGSLFSCFSMADLRAACLQVKRVDSDSWSFMSIDSGEAILDIGATQDLIGLSALDQVTSSLKEVGLQPLRVDGPMSAPSGIGGAAKALFKVLLPISPGGIPGVLEMTVLEGAIPPLLSVGFLDFLQAEIRLPENVIEMKALGVTLPMRKLHTGHRTIPLIQWNGGDFPVPETIKTRYGILDGAFNIRLAREVSASVYKARSGLGYMSHEASEIQGIDQPSLTSRMRGSCPSSASSCSRRVTSPASSHVRLGDDDCVGVHQQRGSTSCMGGRLAKTSQFVNVLPHQDERFSPEPGGERPGAPPVDSASDLHRPGLGAESSCIHLPGAPGAAEDHGQDEAAASRWTPTNEVPPPGGSEPSPCQSVRRVDGVSGLSGPDILPFPADSAAQGSRQGQDCDGVHDSSTTDGPADGGEPDAGGQRFQRFQCGGDCGTSSPRHAGPVDRVRPGYVSDRRLLAAAGTRAEPAHPDGPGTAQPASGGEHFGGTDPSSVRSHNGGRGERRDVESLVRPSWPTWMLLTGVALQSSFVEWHQLSAEFQQVAESQNFSDRDVFFLYDWREGTSSADVHLGSDPEVPCWPCWVPSFCQLTETWLSSGETIPSTPPSGVALWRQLRDEAGNVLESSPGPHLTIKAQEPILARWWFLPRQFLQHLCLSEEGSMPRSFAGYEYVWGLRRRSDAHDSQYAEVQRSVGSDRDLLACSRNLCLLARKESQLKQLSKLDLVELFSSERFQPHAQALGLRMDGRSSFDLRSGWDVNKAEHRRSFRKYLVANSPCMLMASPECRKLSLLQHLRESEVDPEELQRFASEDLVMWQFALDAVERQLSSEGLYGLAHPATAPSWRFPATQRLLQRPDAVLVVLDLCAWGPSVLSDGEPSRGATKVATNNPWLAWELCAVQGDRRHALEVLLAGFPGRAQYPEEFCQCVARSTLKAIAAPPSPSFFLDVGNVGDAGVHLYEEDEEVVASPETSDHPRSQVTEAQKRLIRKVHVNTGHPPLERFLRAMKAAGAHAHVLAYIKKEFRCDECDVRHGPSVRRKAQLPRTFAFNQLIGVDFFYVAYGGRQVPFLNVVCLGTSFQIAVRGPTSQTAHGGTIASGTAWNLLLTTWIRHYGAPQLVMCDSGLEFKGLFERGLEQMGILQHVIHPESPWENGKVERHGGWLKSKLEKELQAGQSVITSAEDLDELVAALTSTKNNWLNKGGFTPSQLVFGATPRIPGELLAEDELASRGLEDAYQDPLGVDEAAGEYRRRHQIRERARQLAMEQSSRDAVMTARKAPTHQDRHWAPGQWVYVFRRARPSQELHLRDRWVGPGVVVLSNNGTVYVGMRTRLWRCSSDQLRPALPSEVLGRELATDPGLSTLLRQVLGGVHAGAVDVAREGPPGVRDQLAPVQRLDEGVELAVEPLRRHADLPSEAAQSVEAIPSPCGS